MSRANAFLWMIFHYLSPPDAENPFDDEYSHAHPGKAPKLVTISREEMLRENQDPQEEIEWGRRMSAMRSKFLKELVDEMEAEKRRKKNPPLPLTTQTSTFSNTLSSKSRLSGHQFLLMHPRFQARSLLRYDVPTELRRQEAMLADPPPMGRIIPPIKSLCRNQLRGHHR